MSDKNYELELYKLIVTPREDDLGFSYVSEFGWVNDEEFLVWVSFNWFKEFMDKLTEIFGYGIFDDGNFNANIQSDTVCIVLNDVLDTQVILQLLVSKGIVTREEVSAMREKVKNSQKYKTSYEYLENAEQKAKYYKSNPEQHLKDIFNAKMNGTIT